jgi:transcriptional regulator with XRE-family HTH domain
MTTDASDRGRAGEAARERVRYLLLHRWGGNQREMARTAGVSQGLISKVVNGVQFPGRRLLSAIAAVPGVSAEWVTRGSGQPIPFPERGSLPIAVGVLPGAPLEFPHLLSASRHPIAEALNRPTRYWLALTENSPLVREPALRLSPGDLLLLEADKEWTSRRDLSDGRLCGVRCPGHSEPRFEMGIVWWSPRGSLLRLVGGSFTPHPPATSKKSKPRSFGQRRHIRPLELEEAKAQMRRQIESESQKAADSLPIDLRDIVAIQVYMTRPELLLSRTSFDCRLADRTSE